MGLDEELGSCKRSPAGMPVQIVQGAQYTNDVVCSVFGKFTQARNYQKSTEYRGGIWECSPVKERVTLETSSMDTSNNLTNKTFSLDEILACDDEESDTEMKENDNLLSNQNKPAKVSANASSTENTVDLNNKRWRSEEFDKAYLLPCNDSEATRKKSKKSVSFSDTIVNLEDSRKSTDITRKYVDIDVMEDKVSDLKETGSVDEGNQMKNSVMLASEDVNDIPVKMKDKKCTSEEKSALKGSTKVKAWIKLVSQSSNSQLSDQQPNELKQKEVASKKSIPKERRRSRKIESNDCNAKNETILETSSVTNKVKKEELINRSHLENAMPELFEFIDSKTEGKFDRRSRKQLKDELIQDADEISDIRNIALEIKKTSRAFKKNPPMKDVPPHNEMDLSKNELESSSFKKDNALELKENEIHLRNVLLKFFNDDAIAESIKTQVVKLAEQKNKMDVASEKEKNKSMSDEKQVNIVPLVEHNNLRVEKAKKEQTTHILKLSEEYQSKSGNCVQKQICCPPNCEKSACKEPIFEKMVKDKIIGTIAERTNSTPRKVSPAVCQSEKNLNSPPSSSRKSDLCSNWRTQCIDVRQRDMNEDKIPQSSASLSWRNEYTNSGNKTSRDNDHYFRRNHPEKLPNKMDMSLKTDYVEEDPIVVIPLNLSEPPDPLSRFKGLNADPESIWDAPEEKTRSSRQNNQIQLQKNIPDMKNGSKPEEIHAQLFRKGKTTSIPRFFDTPPRMNADYNYQNKISKEQCATNKNDSAPPMKLNENYRSRSQSRQIGVQHRSFERNRSTSAHWRSPISTAYLEYDVFFIIKIKSQQDGAVEKFKILKEEFFEMKRENMKLSEIIPDPGYQPRKIGYSACAVNMFVRCVFSKSYQIPNWMMALEAFSLGKKFRVTDLMQECEAYFMNYKIPSEQIHQVAISAKQLQAVEALKSSKYFQIVQNVTSSSDQNIFITQSCLVSCSVLGESSEFAIPLHLEINRGLESCNEADVKNSVFFKSLTNLSLKGIQLKFLAEDMHFCTELHIVCEVFESKKKLFFKELDKKAKSSIKISFEEEIDIKFAEQVEISVFIDSVLLKMCPQLTDIECVSPGKFHARFESSKTIGKNKLFCIEKLLYSFQA